LAFFFALPSIERLVWIQQASKSAKADAEAAVMSKSQKKSCREFASPASLLSVACGFAEEVQGAK
jgi:hypothetical protein